MLSSESPPASPREDLRYEQWQEWAERTRAESRRPTNDLLDDEDDDDDVDMEAVDLMRMITLACGLSTNDYSQHEASPARTRLVLKKRKKSATLTNSTSGSDNINISTGLPVKEGKAKARRTKY
jgi:hypothetical protein